MNNIIEIKHLKKYFGDIKAVDDLSFSVQSGTLFAFLGINGAGKSTTINILCTLLAKDSGDVKIDGYDLDVNDFEIKQNIGIVFQKSILDNRLTVKENLTIRASYYGLRGKEWEKRLNEITEMLELKDLLNRPFGKLSGGQMRRVDIARGLINTPKLLFLDEPTTGLDPKTRRMIWDIINKIRVEHNMTVFLTTHYMEEAEQANMVVIIDSGKIIAHDTPNNLKNIYSGNYIKLYSPENDILTKLLKDKNYTFTYENNTYSIKFKTCNDALDFLVTNKNYISDFEVVKGNMDDVFLNATGKKLEV